MTPVPPDRPPPQNTVQAASRAVESVVVNLRDNPALLVLVILNVVGIGAALWFLSALVTHSRNNFDNLLKVCSSLMLKP
jgi:hypothetical protein